MEVDVENRKLSRTFFGLELQAPAGVACGPASKPFGQLTDHCSQKIYLKQNIMTVKKI